MKLWPLILLLLAGCAAGPGKPPSPPVPPMMTLQSSAQSEAVVLPDTNGILLHLEFPEWPLTNCFVQGSTDLVTWYPRTFVIVTNKNESTEWVVQQMGRRQEFFRVGGQRMQFNSQPATN